MDLTTIITIITISLGFFIGKLISGITKEETTKGKIFKTIQDLLFGIIIFFLLIICNINWIISILLALVYTCYIILKKKEHKKISLIILAAAIASVFRTKYFLTASSTAFIYTLITGLRTKHWKEIIKKTLLVLILSLILIYLRTI